MRAIHFILCVILGIFAAMAGPSLVLAGFERGETGRVARVIDGDSLVLESGLEVRLAQIEAPRVRPGDTWGPQATRALSQLVAGQQVELRYGGLRRDRRGRALAQVYVVSGAGGTSKLWVQQALLRAGVARVHTYADNRVDVALLWQAEREARRADRGIWTSPAYQVRFATPQALQGGLDSFQLVEGKVTRVGQRGKVVFINFGTDPATDVTAIVPERALPLWSGGLGDLQSLKDQTIRVRGLVRNANGPSIWLDHPEQIEFIISPPASHRANRDMQRRGS